MHGGDGPPFVYLHSTLGESFRWLPFYQAWAKQFRVLVPTHPGFGKSGGFDQIDTIEDMAFHYVELFDALGLDEVILGGVSLGGWIAAEFAVRWPERVKKLWLADAPGLWVDERAAARPVPRHARPHRRCAELLFHDPDGHMATTGHPGRPRRGAAADRLPGDDGAGPAGVGTALRSEAGRPAAPRPVSDAAAVGRRTTGWCRRPTARRTASTCRRRELKLIPDCGHLPMFEKEEEFVETVANFCKEVSRGVVRQSRRSYHRGRQRHRPAAGAGPWPAKVRPIAAVDLKPDGLTSLAAELNGQARHRRRRCDRPRFALSGRARAGGAARADRSAHRQCRHRHGKPGPIRTMPRKLRRKSASI